MDKKKSFLNVSFSIGFKVILLLLALLSRRFLIKFAGNDANGLNSLYTSIIGFLAIADLGVGTAINFSMYKPIVEGDEQKVSALYNLYKKIYLIIGGIILAVGLILMPFLPTLAKGYSADYNIYLNFFIVLIATVVTYVFSAQTSLINAYKNNYITTTINSVGQIIKYGLQLLLVYLTHSLELFFVSMLVANLIEWIITEVVTRKKYKNLISTKEKVDSETKNQIIKNAKAMFMHKIGNLLVNTADSIIISAFIGVVILGKYANYMTIMTAMMGILSMFFTPLTAVIGHLSVEGNKEEERKYFWFMYLLNFVIGVVFFLGYYGTIDNIISICFGADLVMGKSVSFIITLNYFIQFMRKSVLLFRDATGTFYYDRWKPIIEGLVNIVLSITFVYWIGLVGVIVATIITNLLICHIIEPLVLYKHAFKRAPVRYYPINYGLIFVFAICLIAVHFSLQHFDGRWVEFLINGSIAVAIAIVPIIIIACVSKTFRSNTKELIKDLLSFFKKKNKNNLKKKKVDIAESNIAEISNSNKEIEENN